MHWHTVYKLQGTNNDLTNITFHYLTLTDLISSNQNSCKHKSVNSYCIIYFQHLPCQPFCVSHQTEPFLASSFSKSTIMLHLLFLRSLPSLCLAIKKNPCYFCDICGYFGALLGFFCLELCYICYFSDLCALCIVELPRKILVTFAVCAIFADFSGP